jgi:alcohol dehydrogenase (cytochrome c)/quinohemoprotein ethanol dehydrogenase
MCADRNVLRIWRTRSLVIAAAACACGPSEPGSVSAPEHGAAVNAERLAAADREPDAWMAPGRTYDEQRFSPLDQIDTENVAELGLAWFAEVDTDRGQEATPIVVDGALYVSTAWSKVKAYDAATGEPLWAYDPQVPKRWAVNACCDVVNRGVAVWDGKVFVGTLDGRLAALDSQTGRVIWVVSTIDRSRPYTITGAPRVVKGLVMIGNGGAEFGVRGYVSAYDARTGDMAWRFYTVPGNPAHGFEQPELERAAQTWNGEWWELGGGGTVWDSMAYDLKLDLLYVGVGNGAPWNQAERSPGGGDNLFLSSIVALRPETGQYVWHYQTTPGETWDYTATQHIVVADLEIGGASRRVVMQAPKNGFFYVLDAATGELISAESFAPVNWASGIDLATGRPVENPEARWGQTGAPFVAVPGPGGAHNWHPMTYSPLTGLVYVPVQYSGFPYMPEDGFEAAPQGFNTGADFAAAAMPQDPEVKASVMAGVGTALLAWDPATQGEVWRVPFDVAAPGGLLSTAGGLVFGGNGSGVFAAYHARTGDRLWSAETDTGILAAPMSYEIGGVQHVALMVGTGGIWALAPGEVGAKGGGLPNVSRLLVYALGGDAQLPASPPKPELELDPPEVTALAEVAAAGARLYARYCGVCHGDAAVSAGMLSDLRASATLRDDELFDEIVLGGTYEELGMAPFAAVLEREDVRAVRAYLIARANEDLERQRAAKE